MTHHVFRYGGEFADLVIERAGGAYVYGSDGRPILDFTSGQMSGILCHSHLEIVETVHNAIAELDRSWHGVTGGAAASTYSDARQGAFFFAC